MDKPGHAHALTCCRGLFNIFLGIFNIEMGEYTCV